MIDRLGRLGGPDRELDQGGDRTGAAAPVATTRFLRLVVVTAEQASNRAARIYEVEVTP